MNDELFRKQLDDNIPQIDSTRQIHSPAAEQQFQQALHARAWESERTQHIVWELPANPRFQVTRGGLRRDWTWLRPIAANIAFLSLFIIMLMLWPHSHPRPASSANPSQPVVPVAQATLPSSPAAYRVAATSWQSSSLRTNLRPGYSPIRRSFPARPSLYAGNPIHDYTPAPTPIPFRATSYRVAPSAPIANSIPALQSPY